MHPSLVFGSLYRPEGGQRPSPGRLKKQQQTKDPRDPLKERPRPPKWTPNHATDHQHLAKSGTRDLLNIVFLGRGGTRKPRPRKRLQTLQTTVQHSEVLRMIIPANFRENCPQSSARRVRTTMVCGGRRAANTI